MIYHLHKRGWLREMEVQYKNLDYPKTRELCIQIFQRYGFSEKDALDITTVLLMADLYGIESHGIQRMIRYHNAMLDGEVDANAQIQTLHETPISATLDAHKGMGQVVGNYAMRLAMEKAKKCGIGMVAVRRSNHYGIAGYYTRLAAEADLMGVCMTNTEAIMVPTFGKKAMLGTNPIAVSMPADPTPFLFDAAATVVPRGKLEVYNKREKPMPQGWALDEKGHDTTDAAQVLHNIIHKMGGGIAPLGGTSEETGGYKGYGFGLICELFTAIMAGGLTSNHCVTQDRNEIAHCFWAIDYGIFGEKAQIKRSFSALLQELRESPKADGQDRIYIHGEKELESYAAKVKAGIPVNRKTFDEIQMIASYAGLDAGAYIGKTF